MQPMQVTITLDGRESAALRSEAIRELRKPKDQARILIRRALGLADHQQEPLTGNTDSHEQHKSALGAGDTRPPQPQQPVAA